jgi:hypothetical protein
MKIIHLSQTPIAGAAYFASEAFKEAGYDSTCIAWTRYHDGREFPTDYIYPPNTYVLNLIYDADLIFCHQGKPYNEPWYPRTKPTIGWYHSQPTPGHINRNLEKDGWPWCVEGQYQTRLYDNAVPVPNLYPLKHPWFQLREKADKYTIAYSPSNVNGTGWDDKGYDRTVNILRGLPCEVDIITGVSIEECLSRKARAHMVIDECVTGSYHRSTLDGIALNCWVINKCDDLCIDNIRLMTGAEYMPFTSVSLDMLDGYLRMWISRYKEPPTHNREWFERYWNPELLIKRNFEPLMEQALGNRHS